jgi:hypothetical protein
MSDVMTSPEASSVSTEAPVYKMHYGGEWHDAIEGGQLDGRSVKLVLYNQPLAGTAAAVLIYHGISLWLPGLLGSVAFAQLRRTLQRNDEPAAICTPVAEPIATVPRPERVGVS